MSHALAADGGTRHFHAAFIAGDAFVTGVFIFAAIALPIAGGAEDSLAEQPVLFGSQAAVVDCFGFEHLAIRPRHDRFGRSQADAECG